MLYRPLLLLLLFRLLHSSVTAKHLTMNSLPMSSSDGRDSFSFLFSLSLSLARAPVLFFVSSRCVHWSIGQTRLSSARVKRKRKAYARMCVYRSHFSLSLSLSLSLSQLADAGMLIIISVHRRSPFKGDGNNACRSPLSPQNCSVSLAENKYQNGTDPSTSVSSSSLSLSLSLARARFCLPVQGNC